MKKKFKKLSLSTETLRHLGDSNLKNAVGAASEDTLCTNACTFCTAACSVCTRPCTECITCFPCVP